MIDLYRDGCAQLFDLRLDDESGRAVSENLATLFRLARLFEGEALDRELIPLPVQSL